MDRKGLVLPLAIILMLLTSIAVFNLTMLIRDKLNANDNGITNISLLVRREADNALAYGIWATNTPASEGGHKCSWNKHLQTEYEITNEDNGDTKIGEYSVKRFVTFSGSTDDKNAILTGIARIYDKNNQLLLEKAVSMNLNLLYSGQAGVYASNSCDATMVEMKKDTYKEVKNILKPVYIPPEEHETRTGINKDKCAPLYGNVSGCNNSIYHKANCSGDFFKLVCTFPVKGYIQIENGNVTETAKTPSGAKATGSSPDILTTLNGKTVNDASGIIQVNPNDTLRIENVGENFMIADEALQWDKELEAKDYDKIGKVKYTSSFSERETGKIKYYYSYD